MYKMYLRFKIEIENNPDNSDAFSHTDQYNKDGIVHYIF